MQEFQLPRIKENYNKSMKPIAILGIFVADTAYHASRQPNMGETLKGSKFALGPGGKGSNQAVAAARLGSQVAFISKLGDDQFGHMALDMWRREGIEAKVEVDPGSSTGAAYIFVDEASGDNAIIVVPGAAGEITPEDVQRNSETVAGAGIFMTQLETSVDSSIAGLRIAKSSGVTTVLNPAPAADLEDAVFGLCDFLTPNESEAELLTGRRVESAEDARFAAADLRRRGAGSVVVTLGENGALFDDGEVCIHVPPVHSGPVVETTGAGDSFCGAFVHAIANGRSPLVATRYACAAASLSVTKPGTAPSMPTASEVARVFREE